MPDSSIHPDLKISARLTEAVDIPPLDRTLNRNTKRVEWAPAWDHPLLSWRPFGPQVVRTPRLWSADAIVHEPMPFQPLDRLKAAVQEWADQGQHQDMWNESLARLSTAHPLLQQRALVWVLEIPEKKIRADFFRERLRYVGHFTAEVDPLFAPLFFPLFDNQHNLNAALAFLRGIRSYSPDELQKRLETLPKIPRHCVRANYYLDGNVGPNHLTLMVLSDENIVRPLPLQTKLDLIIGLIHFWSIDPQHNIEGPDYFSNWIDQITKFRITHWTVNREEAFILYATLRAMIDRSPSFLAWLQKYLPDFEFPPFFYGPKEYITAEIAGLCQKVLASPYFENSMRIPLAVEVRELEYVSCNFHGESNIMRGRPIGDAILGEMPRGSRELELDRLVSEYARRDLSLTRQVHLDTVKRRLAGVEPRARHLLIKWLDVPEPERQNRIEILAHLPTFEIPSLFDPVFFPSPDPEKSLSDLLLFLEALDDIPRRRLYELVEALPSPFKAAFKGTEDAKIPNGFNVTFRRYTTFPLPRIFIQCPIEVKQQILWRLARLFSIDPYYLNEDRGYFGDWIDVILGGIQMWANNSEEALILYASARGMIDRSRTFRRWVRRNLPAEFLIPPLYHFERDEPIVAEINKIALRALASPHFPIKGRARLVAELGLLEQTLKNRHELPDVSGVFANMVVYGSHQEASPENRERISGEVLLAEKKLRGGGLRAHAGLAESQLSSSQEESLKKAADLLSGVGEAALAESLERSPSLRAHLSNEARRDGIQKRNLPRRIAGHMLANRPSHRSQVLDRVAQVPLVFGALSSAGVVPFNVAEVVTGI